jgi:hypothetical protein
MSKDGPASGGLYFDPWYKPRPIAQVNAELLTGKLIRRVTELRCALKAQGLTESQIVAELAALAAEQGYRGNSNLRVREK